MIKTKHLNFAALMTALLIYFPAMSQRMEYSFPDSRGPYGINLQQEHQSGLKAFHSIPELALYDIDVDGETMKMIEMQGFFLQNEEGAPNLPGQGQYIAVPKGAQPVLIIHNVKKNIIRDIELAPAPNIPLANDDDPLHFTKNEKIYGHDAYYPAEPFLLSDLETIRGVDVVMLGITPFQYNPVSKELIIYYDIDFEIAFEGGTGQYGDPRLRSRWWDPILYDAILNSNQLPKIDYSSRYHELKQNRSTGSEYIVIVPDHPDFIAWADSIRLFRTRQGITTQVVTTTEIGGNNHILIKNYLADAYNTWDIPPAAFLLLADYGTTGNTITSETRTDHPYAGTSSYISDNFYTDMNGNHMPDMTMARITARNASELEIMVNKFLNYERTPPTNTDFYNNPITAMGWQTERWFQICSEVVNGFWEYELGKEPLRQNNIYSGSPGSIWSSAPNTTTVVNTFGPNGLNYIPATPAHLHSFGWNANASSINQAINSGAFMVMHRDHGLETGWGEPHYRNEHLAGLNNDDLTFVFSINCLTGKFNWGQESFTEAMHRHPKAALGLTAASEISYSFVNDTYVWGMMDNMWPEFLPLHGTNPASRDILPAFGNIAGKYFLQQSNWPYNTEHKRITYYLFHHHGDAFNTVYTQMPQELSVLHPDVILSITTEFSITTEEGALIAITLNDELIGVGEGTGSETYIPISEITPGDQLLLTVTLQDHYRYEAFVEVIPPDGPYIISTDVLIGDEDGNGNNLIDYGEVIDLGIELKNVGLESATNVTALLSTDSEYLTLLETEQFYGELLPDQIELIENAFRFSVSDNIPNNTILNFQLEITGEEDVWLTDFKLVAFAPEFSIGNFLVDDNEDNGHLDPGETADIIILTSNTGGSDASQAIATVILNDPWVTLNNDEYIFDEFDSGLTLGAMFNVTVSPNAPIGHTFSFVYSIESGAYTGSHVFTAKVGQILEDFETGDFSQFDWVFSGHQPWTISNFNSYEGVYSAKSGNITHSQQTRMMIQYDVGAQDTISFYRRVSSESGYDFLRFYINGLPVGEWSGNVPWGKVSFPVSAGLKVFTWEYRKDQGVSSGEDAAWVDYISFPPPVATSGSAGNDAEICELETLQLNGFANHYNSFEWTSSGTGSFCDPYILNPEYTPSLEDIEAGQVILTLHIDGITVDITDEVQLIIHKQPTIYAGEDASICIGDVFEVQNAEADHFNSVLWESTGSGTFDNPQSLNPIYIPGDEDYENGNVLLSVVAYGFETCPSAMDSFELHFNVLPSAEIAGSQEICLGESAVITFNLTGEAPWIINLSNEIEAIEVPSSPYTWQVFPEVTTTYRLLSVTDGNGCENEAAGEVMISLNYAPDTPIKPIGSDTVDHFLVESSVYQIETVENAYTYEWFIEPEHAGTITTDETNATIVWNTEYIGQADLSVKAGNDCGISEASSLKSIVLYSTVGLDENSSQRLSIYPNPSDGKFTIHFQNLNAAPASIRVRNLLGELVYAENILILANQSEHIVELDHLISGMYILSVEHTNKVINKRIIIHK